MNLKRITSIFSIIMIFMFTIGQSLLPIIANAQELNTAGLVDGFHIDKTNLQTGESTQITVSFSEKDGVKLMPGDTLTLTLPSELEGFRGTIQLEDYGVCKVNAGTVVCTFNDKVDVRDNILGYLKFNVTATGVGTDQKKEIDTNFGTNLDKQHVIITGPTGGGGTDPGKGPFFYKAGDMRGNNENEVRWFLNINLNKEELSSDIVVTDKLQEGQTLNKDSFYINVNDYLGYQRLTPKQLEEKGYGKFIFNDDGSFKIVLYQNRARLASFTVEYTSTITEAGKKQEYFKNDFKIDYQIHNKKPVTESGTAETKNMSAEGGISGNKVPKGKLKIVKHIEGNKEKVIPNVSFKLYKESGEQVGGEYKTNEKGIVETEKLPSGKYYLLEVSAPNYIDFDPQKKIEFEIKSDAETGIELPISNKVKTISVSGTKVWDDYNNKFGKRPGSITVQLLQNEKEFKTQEVKADKDGKWNFSFTGLPMYDEQGTEFKYKVSEVKVDGYEIKIDGTTITNTYKNTDKIELNGKKVWDDYNNKFKTRPESITVQLLQNEKEIKTQEVKADQEGNWNFSFKDLPKYDEQGNEFKYTVGEVKVNGYETKIDGTTITNTYKNTEVTELSGKKVWDDYNNKFKTRPESITVQLLQNEKEIKTQEVKADQEGNWNFSFKDLPKYDEQGNEFKYTVSEVKVKDYETKVDGTTITNTYKNTDTTKISGKKTWNDNNAKDRPSTIKVDLLQNGQVIDTKEVSAATNWMYTFDNLQAYDANGVAYKYGVKEQPVPGYESKVDGFDITNTKVGKVNVEGTKTWNDNNATDRPSSIKVDLYQNGTVLLTQYVISANDWKYTFADLPAYDANGKAYTYTVKEQLVPGYESKVNGYDITNTKVGETKVEGTKTWKDDNAKDRPTMIKVDLLQNGKVIATQEVTVATEWKYTFEKLQAYDANGVAYKYEVKEQAVEGYKSEVNGTDITNTKVGETKVEGTKTWKDDNVTDRPKMIKVDLLQNGKVIATQEVSEATGWKYEFKDLAAYDANGVAYKYEVKEQAVEGYKSEVNGTDITNTKVGETKVEGTKTWKDDNATDRPTMIKVDLLQNGKVIDTKEVSAATNWKYTFDNLKAYDANGVAYKYEVKEQAVEGYKSEVNGTDITNTKVGETKVEGTKTWKGDNAKDRPKMIKVDLLQNGKVIATKEVSEATSWKYAFTDLAAYDVDGKAYKYEVKEQPVDGYKSEVTGYDITNTKIPESTNEDPKDPNKGPNVDPKDPNTNSNSKVPSNKENETVLLPKTGGAPAEMISIVSGIVLFVLGGILFARQRIKQ